jgi:hypothetical protein
MKIKLFMAIVLALMSTACTYTKIESPEVKATYIGFNPTGNAVEAEVSLNGLGRAKVSRNSEGAEDLVDEVGDIVNPVPFQ